MEARDADIIRDAGSVQAQLALQAQRSFSRLSVLVLSNLPHTLAEKDEAFVSFWCYSEAVRASS